MCGINLKKLWCQYSCNPEKNKFVEGLGYIDVPMGDHMQNMTKVKFTVEENTACDLFRSCKKVSLIAQASVQSSISFLDFLVSYMDVLMI